MAATSKSGPEPTPTVSLDRDLPAELRAAERTVLDVLHALRAAECNCGDLSEIQLALGEALANAVRHGCRLNPRKRIAVQCRYHPAEGLWLVVRDPGAGRPGKHSRPHPAGEPGEIRWPRNLFDPAADGRGRIPRRRTRNPHAKSEVAFHQPTPKKIPEYEKA